MRRSPELKPTRWDILVVLAVVLLAVTSALAVWGRSDPADQLTAVVLIDGEEADRIDLQKESGTRSYCAHGYTLTVDFRPDGAPGVRVETSDCPTQDCVHTGTITRAGQSIVCLPARMIIQLEGTVIPDSDAPDVIIG